MRDETCVSVEKLKERHIFWVEMKSNLVSVVSHNRNGSEEKTFLE